jgi:formate/nitrite transporter
MFSRHSRACQRRVWGIVYVGNFIGALGTAALVYLSGQPPSGAASVAAVALRLAADKAALPFDKALFLGVLCNVLVCLAVWLGIGARTVADKVLAVLFPVSAFVAAGFEHSVANMYLIPLGLFLKAGAADTLWAQVGARADFAALTWPAFIASLIPVTIGNIIGGGALVGGTYWCVYLRGRADSYPRTRQSSALASPGVSHRRSAEPYSAPNTLRMIELACPTGSLRIARSSSAIAPNNPSRAFVVT